MAATMRWMGLVLVLAAGPAFAQEQIVWQTDIAKAVKQAKAEKKLVLVHFYGDTCGPCKEVEKKVFPQPEVVQAMMRNYVPVKVNLDKNEKIGAFYGIREMPQDVFLAGTGQVLNRAITKDSATDYATYLDNYAIQTGIGSAREATFRERASRYEQPTQSAELPQVDQKLVQNQFVSQGGAAINNRYAQGGPQYDQAPQEAVQNGGTPAAAPGPAPMVQAPVVQAPKVSYGSQPELPAGQQDNIQGYAPQGGQRSESAQATMQRTNFQDSADITTRQQIRNYFIPLKDIPPVGMDGYCPVSVSPLGPKQEGVWKKGDKRFGAVHRGRTYLFASAAQQDKFLADPDAYSPILSGADPVIFAETGKLVDGKRKFGMSVPHDGRNEMYFFTSEENLLRFKENPQRFVTLAHQAMLKGETGR